MAMIHPLPASFPHKGEFRTYDRTWNFTGYSAERQYPGQVPITYPTDATLLEIQLGGYIVP